VLLGLALGAAPILGCGSGGGSNEGPTDAGLSDGAVSDSMTGTLVVVADAALLGPRPCAAATSLVAAPNEVAVGHSITMTAAGVDPGYEGTDVDLTWVASGNVGALSSTSGSTVTFNCMSAGTTSVTVTATIAEGGASCPENGSLTAVLDCRTP
jgi:hypothetical protein